MGHEEVRCGGVAGTSGDGMVDVSVAVKSQKGSRNGCRA